MGQWECTWPIPRTLWVFRWCCFISPADPSLTPSSVSAALETVKDVERVEYILETPHPKRSQPGAQHANERDQRAALAEYYLQTHPLASWEHLAGKCLFEEEEYALQEMKKGLQPDEGMEIYIVGTCSHADCD